MKGRLVHHCIHVMDLEASLEFYEKALGLKPGWKTFDFETGKPAGLALTVEPYDFRVVIFKQEGK